MRPTPRRFDPEKAAVIPDEIKGWDKNGADEPGIFTMQRARALMNNYGLSGAPIRRPRIVSRPFPRIIGFIIRMFPC